MSTATPEASTAVSPGDSGPDGAGAGAIDAGSLLGRFAAAGINLDRARHWIETGAVSVAGEMVTDPDHPTPSGTRWSITPQ